MKKSAKDTQTEVVGLVEVEYNGITKTCEVHRDGSFDAGDGTASYVDEATLAELTNSKSAADRAEAMHETLEKKRREAPPFIPGMIPAREKTPEEKEEEEARKKESARRRKILNIVVLIIVVAAIAATSLVAYAYWPQISSEVTGEYNVCVVNRDITAGEVLTDADIGFVTISAEEYGSLCANHFLDGDGTLVQDAPIFFVNRARDAVSKYTTTDLSAGGVLLLSAITGQQKTEDKYLVQTVDSNGTPQTTTVDGSAFDGDTTIQYVAIVTTSDGKKYEVVLSTLQLRDKTLADILNADGTSLMQDYVDSESGAANG